MLAEPDEETRQHRLLTALGDVLAPELGRLADDTAYRTVREAVDLMRRREHTTLAPVAAHLHVSTRTLQRMFIRDVGVSPLAVLRRYRIQDAATALDAGQGEDLAALAMDLGFADQPHFTRAFTAMIGVSPGSYRAAATVGRSSA